MAIYHLNVRGVSPARGSSAVKSAAYQSGERLRDARTGELCDYSRKERVSATGIELPDGAPAWARERQRLWDEATAAWAGGTSLVARRVIVALPRELDPDLAESAVRELASRWTAEGRAVDWAIHEQGGANPHAHLLVTARPLGADGFARPKAPANAKAYLCRNSAGEEREVVAAEWKQAKAAGWEKVFRWRTEAGEERLTRSEAKARGLTVKGDRVSSSPVATVRRADGGGADALGEAKAELVALRAAWATVANARLAEQAGRDGAAEAARIDHRSNAARGLDAEPTVHEGPAVTAIERRREQAAAAAAERDAMPSPGPARPGTPTMARARASAGRPEATTPAPQPVPETRLRELNEGIRARNRLMAAALAELARLREALARAKARARAGWARAAVEPARWARAATRPAGAPAAGAEGSPAGDVEASLAAGIAAAASAIASGGSWLAREASRTGAAARDARTAREMAALAAPTVRERAAGRAEGREAVRHREDDAKRRNRRMGW